MKGSKYFEIPLTIYDILKQDTEYLDNFVLRSVHESSAIEGNSLTLSQTQTVLFYKEIPTGVSLRELNEVQNLNSAFLYLFSKENEEITINLMHDVHRIVLMNIDSSAGEFKKFQNIVGGSLTTRPELVSQEIKVILDNLYLLGKPKTLLEVLVRASNFHIQFEGIHPYQDGNGRTGRLLLNHILMCYNLPPVNIPKDKRSVYFDFIRYREVEEFAKFIEELMKEELRFLNRNGLMISLDDQWS